MRRSLFLILMATLVLIGNDGLMYVVVRGYNQKQLNTRVHLVNLLRAQSAGECYRVNYQRFLTNRANYARWRTSTTFANDLKGFITQTEHNPDLSSNPALKRQVVLTRTLLVLYRDDANATRFAPLTNCLQALSHPTTYTPPKAVDFNSSTFKHLRYQLRRPPLTPTQGHYDRFSS